MFVFLLFLALLALSQAAQAPVVVPADAPVVEAVMPLKIVRAEGGSPAMGEVSLSAGGPGDERLLDVDFDFNSDGERLGAPSGVGMSLRLGAYCRDRPSRLQSVLIAPSGQIWTGHRVAVPAGPDRNQDWSSGYIDDPAVLEAVARGGVFVVALRDDQGRLWNAVKVDTHTPAERERLFDANLEAVRAADPAVAYRAPGPEMLVAVPLERRPLPSPPRPCPATP